MEINDFCNEEYCDLSKNDFLICTIGYEERSSYLLKKNIATRNTDNTLVFFFDDFKQEDWFSETNQAITNGSIRKELCSYDQSDKYINIVLDCINTCSENDNIFIDYSSIPRSWYCDLLYEINKRRNVIRNIPIHFLYSAGVYPEKYTACGIGSLKCFVGQMLPSLEPNKLHIIALGYDVERTQSLITKIEPDSLLACYAYTRLGSREQVELVNKDILERVTTSVALQLNDFRGMLERLNEEIIEQTRFGQVVIIPDGPKPLILAMSMISIINFEKGREVVCLHVSRNNNMIHDHKVQVKPSEKENDIYCVRFYPNKCE